MPMLHPDEMANANLAAVVGARRRAGRTTARLLRRRLRHGRRRRPAAWRAALAAYERTLLAGGFALRSLVLRRRGLDALGRARSSAASRCSESQGCVTCHPVGRTACAVHRRGASTTSACRHAAMRLRAAPIDGRRWSPAWPRRSTPQTLRRIGVPDAPDLGRHEVTRRAADARAFRTPSLRNVALTAPYMHDGSFEYAGRRCSTTTCAAADAGRSGAGCAHPTDDLDGGDRRALLAFLAALTSPAALPPVRRRSRPSTRPRPHRIRWAPCRPSRP